MKIIIDPAEIIAGTSNRTHPAYIEAVNVIDGKDDTRSLAYIKRFVTAIETTNAKISDKRIAASKGNIEKFKYHNTIETGMGIIREYRLSQYDNLNTIYNNLISNRSLYEEAYQKNNRMLVLEYESAVYSIVVGLSQILNNELTMVTSTTNSRVSFTKTKDTHKGIIRQIIEGFAARFKNKNHKNYMQAMLESPSSTHISESVMMEAAVGTLVAETIALIQGFFSLGGKVYKAGKFTLSTLRQTLFGILPLIRSVIYLRYKAKADIIVNLEGQVGFIKRNIEQLKNKPTTDPAKRDTIIKKQEAYVAMYTKKIAKLKAELMDAETAAAEEINKTEPDPKNKDDSGSSDDEFTL